MKDFILCLGIIIIMAILSTNTHAQDKAIETTQSKRDIVLSQATEAEKAAFAFFKLNNTTPDFKNWARNTKTYKKTPFSERRNILEADSQRLKNLFEQYDHRQTPINIQKKIRLTVKKTPTSQYAVELKFESNNEDDKSFITTEFSNEFLAMIMNNADILDTITFTEEDYKNTIQPYWFENVNYTANLNLTLTPISADHNAKIAINGKDQWLMGVHIKNANIDFYDRFNNKNVTLWAYKPEIKNETLEK